MHQLRDELIINLGLDFFDAEEIREITGRLESYAPLIQQKVLSLCHTLAQASGSFVPTLLARVDGLLQAVPLSEVSEWLDEAYNSIDHQGVSAFSSFIRDGKIRQMKKTLAGNALRVAEITAILETFLRAISGRELRIAEADQPYTDTATVFLPSSLAFCPDREGNLLLYKLISATLWVQIIGKGLMPDEGKLKPPGSASGLAADLSSHLNEFPDPLLAADLYSALEQIRTGPVREAELPGLMRRIRALQILPVAAPGNAGDLTKDRFAALLAHAAACGSNTLFDDIPQAAGLMELRGADSASASLSALPRLYGAAGSLEGEYTGTLLPPYFCRIRPAEVSRHLLHQAQLRQRTLQGIISKLLALPDHIPHALPQRGVSQGSRRTDPDREYLALKGRLIELDPDLRQLMEEKQGIPGGILVKGADAHGAASPIFLADLTEEEEAGVSAEQGRTYDEWDFRRSGYKKKWCAVRDREVRAGSGSFVSQTRTRYSGYVTILKRKFGLLRREPRILRRQYDGEGIDLDMAIEAFADSRAGLSPPDNIFLKQSRQERDIAALFLVDMSGSTKGWIIDAEKESLVLMAEALEALGDRYGIYGFSGMTRHKCDYYRIKDFSESYSDEVRKRIDGIEPKDYTRMGAAIRHSAHLLGSVDARTKLLISLSDGRPEDYDAYKANYAIEDTRRALIEAREQGVHSFCITIDKEARSYLRHMYGETAYTMIDDVRKLPNRITEIYRRLTT